MEIVIFEGLGDLPHFNPDLDLDGADQPPTVRDLRGLLAAADGVMISSPEYAHGVPGSLKNALDWLVSAGELVGKPVLLVNASPAGGEWAQASLVETLSVMSWNVLRDASLLAPFVRKKLEVSGSADPETEQTLRTSLDALAAAIQEKRQ
jgi:NAD(P)H-dependent FMN reductase